MTHFFGITGLSGSGKTVLVENIVHILSSKGYKTGVIKHTHHHVETDKKGSDTWKHQQAGAETVVLAGKDRITVFKKEKVVSPVDLAPLFSDMDLVLVEGFKRSAIKKIEVVRAAISDTPVCLDDPFVLAIVTDLQKFETNLRVFSMTDYENITGFIINHTLNS
jgi:molybdopterin-guanine dinucleotide biosynthesis protein B